MKSDHKVIIDTEICGICGSNSIYQGGSWTPEKCLNCGAVYFFGQWMRENTKDEPMTPDR